MSTICCDIKTSVGRISSLCTNATNANKYSLNIIKIMEGNYSVSVYTAQRIGRSANASIGPTCVLANSTFIRRIYCLVFTASLLTRFAVNTISVLVRRKFLFVFILGCAKF